jgi:toxin ParE1/3/4
VATARFSRLAAADLLKIGFHSLDMWGKDQAARYLDQLEECCQMLAERPTLGRPCSEIRPGLRRMEHASHVIFYRPLVRSRKTGGILVSRILHTRMLPERHPIDDKGGER